MQKFNDQIGYGNLTNLIKLEEVWMTTHKEGQGTEEQPMREVLTFFDKKGQMLYRKDIFRND